MSAAPCLLGLTLAASHVQSSNARENKMSRRVTGLVASLGLVIALATPVAAISYGQIDADNAYGNVGALIGGGRRGAIRLLHRHAHLANGIPDSGALRR